LNGKGNDYKLQINNRLPFAQSPTCPPKLFCVSGSPFFNNTQFMRRLLSTAILLLISFLAFCQGTQVILNDTAINFKGDVAVGFFKQPNGIKLLRIKMNDSTFLYKEYAGNNNRLINSYQCNADGYRNGSSWYLDTVSLNITTGLSAKGRIIERYTITPKGDTVGYTRKINDTLFVCMEIKEGRKKVWQCNYNLINNGSYTVWDLSTNQIIVQGNFRAIKESDVLDNKKYNALLKKYNLTNMFRGENNGEELMAEIGVGTWYYYDANGNLTKTIKYDWEDAIRKR
jgi:hypothetical protein